MHDKEDFFSPDMVDERLELSLLQHNANMADQDMAEADPNLQLISDLRYFYGAEGTENVRSLRRVWEHLQKHPTKKEHGPLCPEARTGHEHHLYLLKSAQESSLVVPPRSKRMRGRGLAVLAALLFLVMTTGSLLMIVHLTREAQAQSSASARATSTAAAPSPSMPISNYPYPVPGTPIAVSPPSSETIYALAWSPDGRHLALSTQGKIWLLDVASRLYRPLLDARSAGGSVRALAWSPDGHFLAVGTNPIQIIDAASGQRIYTYSADYPILPVPGQTTLVTALAWSHGDGGMLAVATQHTDGACYVFVWNMLKETGIYTFTDQGSPSGISSVSWSGDNRYVASTDAQTVQAWDIRDGFVIFKQKIDAATAVAWSPGPGLLAFVNRHITQIWDVWLGSDKTGQLVSSYPAGNGVLSWSDKGQYLATAEGRTVIILNASNGVPVYIYRGNTHYVSSLAWSPDGSSIATGESGTRQNVARIWSA